jgi:dTDP-4-dehydrorhamnose 3,5-epimerase
MVEFPMTVNKRTATNIPDVLIIQHTNHTDKRGSFSEIYQQQEFQEIPIQHNFVQDNFVRTAKGALRGLHYQIEKPQGKLLTVIHGELFDVAVDLRKSSPTFGQHVGVLLSGKHLNQIWIPPGFAHGLYSLSSVSEFFYKTTDFYTPKWNRTIRWNDPDLNIPWPIIKGAEVLLSENDAQGTTFRDAEVYP